MKSFFKFVFASALGTFITGIVLFFIIFFVVIGSFVGSFSELTSQNKDVKVKENSILHLQLNREIVERGSKQDFEFSFGDFSAEGKLGLNDIVSSIEKAKTDEKIKGIYLDLTSIPAGSGTIEEIRNALVDFKSSGKWIASYSENYSQRSYYLASVADQIYLYPEGNFEFKGLYAEITFIKGLLDKLELEPQIFRGKNNDYKSFVEPFMLEKMSAENKEQLDLLIGTVWNHYLDRLSASRGITVEQLQALADGILIRKAEDAVQYKLIDELKYKDEVLANLRERVGASDEDKLNFVKLKKYIKAPGDSASQEKYSEKKKSKKSKIAVVYAMGNIQSGEGEEGNIGSERISRAIRKARKDSTIKAIVLRVNSGGGSALASDVIWRETVLAKQEKPFVVSMGDVAASGGYYIACAADKIYAQPNTVTGSIGVLGMILNSGKFFKNKLGITFDGTGTNEHADLPSFTRTMTPFEEEIIQDVIDRIYDDFTAKVATGRNLTQAKVDSIGRGRVWTGIEAQKLGLVDALGGLDNAIEDAAKMANLEDYKVVDFPKLKDPFTQFFEEFSAEVKEAVIKSEMGEHFQLYNQFKHFQSMEEWNGVQARLPYQIEIR